MSLAAGIVLVALIGGLGLIPAAEPAPPEEDAPVILVESVTKAAKLASDTGASGSAALAALARRNPELLPKMALEHYRSDIKDYTCTFWKQERLNGKLGKVEKIDVEYREAPVSVYMRWEQNATEVKRALYMDAPDFVDSQGRKVAKIEPNGAIVRMLVSEVTLPIHGARAKKASRNPMDRFGFRRALELLLADNARSRKEGVLDFQYDGEGEVDGRPTYVLVRYLPYDGDDGKYPNAKMIMHIDQEWLIPTAVYGYADKQATTLLCSYVYTNVKLNPGLTDRDFQF